jgi:uncharacterized membrane protein
MKITLGLIILFIILSLIFFRNELMNNKKILIIFIVGILIVLSLLFEKNMIKEHMTNEAIANCASLYNNEGDAKVRNLTVTGNILLPNGWKISTEDSHCRFKKGDQLKGTIDSSGNVAAVNKLTANNGARTAVDVGADRLIDVNEVHANVLNYKYELRRVNQFVANASGSASFANINSSGDITTSSNFRAPNGGAVYKTGITLGHWVLYYPGEFQIKNNETGKYLAIRNNGTLWSSGRGEISGQW